MSAAAQRRKTRQQQKGYAQQAGLESYVRYAPEQSALHALIRDAQSSLILGTKSDKGAAQIISNSTRAARPQVVRDYGSASSQVSKQQSSVQQQLQALGGAAAPFLAAIAREGGGTQGRLAETRANTLNELTQRSADAQAGFASAKRQRVADFLATKDKVHQRQLDLAREKGAFAAATIGDLSAADKKLEQQDRASRRTARTSVENSKRSAATSTANSKRSAAVSRENSKRTAASKRAAAAAKKRKNGVTKDQSGQAVDQINVAMNWIHRLEQGGATPHQIRDMLEGGRVLPPAKKGLPALHVPAIKHAGGIPGHTLINAAYDIYKLGGLSTPNRRALRGVHIPAGWRHPRKPHAVNLGVGSSVR